MKGYLYCIHQEVQHMPTRSITSKPSDVMSHKCTANFEVAYPGHKQYSSAYLGFQFVRDCFKSDQIRTCLCKNLKSSPMEIFQEFQSSGFTIIPTSDGRKNWENIQKHNRKGCAMLSSKIPVLRAISEIGPITSYGSSNQNRTVHGSGLVWMLLQKHLTRFMCNLNTLC